MMGRADVEEDDGITTKRCGKNIRTKIEEAPTESVTTKKMQNMTQ